jgi:PDZ domain-containing protein
MNHRRTAALAAGALVVLAAVVALVPVPYVAFSPGPTADVLASVDGDAVIEVDGARTFDTPGQLDLTTVSVTPASARLGLAEAMTAWVDPDRAVIPREAVYPEGTSAEEVEQVNAALWTGSQDAASAAALRLLGYEVVEEQRAVVSRVLPDSPAEGLLFVGDIILSVDGEPVSGSADVVTAVSSTTPGDDVAFRVERDGERTGVEVTTVAGGEAGTAAVRVGVSDAVIGYESDVAVTINGPGDIGGSSAGLVFALGIVDRMSPEELLAGRHVAGTGEIDPDGRVGRISGIAQKVSAAASVGATFFLAPVGNCEDVLMFEPDIPVVPVHTLAEAVVALEETSADSAVPPQRCASLEPAEEAPETGEASG